MFTEFMDDNNTNATNETSEAVLFIKWLCDNNWGYDEEELLQLYEDFVMDTNAKDM